jgi:hypothetical protein
MVFLPRVAQEVVQALQAAQEEVLVLAQEQVRVLGLAVAQVEALAQDQKVALEWDLQGQVRPEVQQAVQEMMADPQIQVVMEKLAQVEAAELVQGLVQAEEQVEVLEPWEKRQVVREMELG